MLIEAKDDGSGGDNWTISRAKLQSNHHHQQSNIQFNNLNFKFNLSSLSVRRVVRFVQSNGSRKWNCSCIDLTMTACDIVWTPRL